jgi:adenylate cyclase
MGEQRKGVWEHVREHATHWAIGGVLIALTGFAPEEWLGHALDGLRIPSGALHLWNAGIDLRLVPICVGVAFIVGGVLWRRAVPVPATAHGPDRATAMADAGTPIATTTPLALPLPDKPSIAVLPFNNLSGDPEQEYFSDGIAEDIITELSRTRWLFVIARNSSFMYKGHAVDVKQVARELGVRYVLEGSVRRSGDRVRVTAQLIDAAIGNHLWAERYDGALADVFAVQDQITGAVARAIAPAISLAERQRALRKAPDNLDAWEAYQRGLWHMAKGERVALEQAQASLRRAITLDPLFAAPHAMLAFTHVNVLAFTDPAAVAKHLESAAAEAHKAIELDPDEASALAVLSWVAFCDAQYDVALNRADQALALNPNDPGAYLTKGRTLAFSGRPLEAQEPLATALRLSPRDPLTVWILATIALAQYFAGNYLESFNAADRATRDYPDYALAYRWLAASLGQLGRIDEARRALRQAQTPSQDSFDFFVRARPQWFRPQDHEHMLDGLRKAGWQG